MAEKSLNVPKPSKGRSAPSERTEPPAARRNVSGFDAKPGARPTQAGGHRETDSVGTESPASKPAASSSIKRRRAASKRSPAAPKAGAMKRVHTSLSVEVAMALRERSAASQHTQTDILAEAFVMHGRALVDEHDAGMRSQYEAFGFRPKRPSPRQGRMTVTFYLSELARNSLDDMANEAGHHSRSAYIDAILRRHLGLPD